MKLRLAFASLWLAAGCAWANGASDFIEDLTWPEVRDAIAGGKTVAIVYAGSTEQNGPHLAAGKHNAVARYVAAEVARQLGNALVYPIVPFAPTGDPARKTGHMAFPGSVSVSDKTFAAVIGDVARSAAAAGFKDVMLMGDHGGGQQTLQQLARQLEASFSRLGVHVHYIGDVYFKADSMARQAMAQAGLEAGGHGGIADSAELMFVDPQWRWVRLEQFAAAAAAPEVEGDPRGASIALGEALVALKVNCAVAQIRRELARR